LRNAKGGWSRILVALFFEFSPHWMKELGAGKLSW